MLRPELGPAPWLAVLRWEARPRRVRPLVILCKVSSGMTTRCLMFSGCLNGMGGGFKKMSLLPTGEIF